MTISTINEWLSSLSSVRRNGEGRLYGRNMFTVSALRGEEILPFRHWTKVVNRRRYFPTTLLVATKETKMWLSKGQVNACVVATISITKYVMQRYGLQNVDCIKVIGLMELLDCNIGYNTRWMTSAIISRRNKAPWFKMRTPLWLWGKKKFFLKESKMWFNKSNQYPLAITAKGEKWWND